MAANANGEYKVFKYYEGMCSSGDFTKEIAKVLALGVRSQSVKDIDGNVLEEPFILRSKNWDIVYPEPDTSLNLDLDNLTTDEYKTKIINQVSKISDTVILKTETTPTSVDDEEYDDLTVDEDTNTETRTMYLEIFKPTYIANPEEYPLDCEREGITPKVITKSMYEESYKSTKSSEYPIYQQATMTTSTDTSIGSVDLSQTETESYVQMLQSAYDNKATFSVPDKDGVATSFTINAGYLSKIQQSQADLYSFILSTLNNGEGIEPKVYSTLEELTITITKSTTDSLVTYTVMLESQRTLKNYTIPSGTTITTPYMPIESLAPEFYLDGIYIPLDTTKYRSADNTIVFDEAIEFEASTDGLLVVRYEYSITADGVITDRTTLLNNHYVLMRLFDNINSDGDGPAENIYDSSGNITKTNSHVSPWSKLSWYRDFEEVLLDTLDADISTNQIYDGTVLVPLETAGLNEDTKIRYWINTNNDRFSLIVMGNPSLDYEQERHLISVCYCGRIDSFDNSISDVAGNFALFTSSSTEPCNTVLSTEKRENAMPDFSLTDDDAANENYDEDDFTEQILNQVDKGTTVKLVANCTEGIDEYNVVLADKLYFNREEWPKYIIVNRNTNKPVTGLDKAFKRKFVMENGKSSTCVITLQSGHTIYDDDYCIYAVFSSYQEVFQITSGVSRDIFGNVTDVDKVNDYGTNTSDGVTSISMYHTRSKAYYQKHHMMFATTEEYMSKVMYGKSSYTGEYYADRIKVVHGNDGPRGTLSDLLVIDSSSLYALDELVINKDFEKDPNEYEETFIYFPITAPYSPLSDGPNARYGMAIKKAEVEPTYEDETKILKIAVNELQTLTQDAWDPTITDIIPRDTTSNGCSVYWKVLEDTAWLGSEDNSTDYVPVQLVVVNTSEYKGDTTTLITPTENLTVTSGSKIADKINAYVKLSGFTPDTDGTYVMYGICTEEEAEKLKNGLGTNAQIKTVISDECTDSTYSTPETFEYGISGVPYTSDIDSESIDGNTDITLVNAEPDKYIVVYSVKQDADGKYIILKYDLAKLKKNDGDKNDLLQYPCSVIVSTESGLGETNFTVGSTSTTKSTISETVDYDSTVVLKFIPDDGFVLDKVILTNPDLDDDDSGKEETRNASDLTDNGGYKSIELDNIHHDWRIRVQYTTA